MYKQCNFRLDLQPDTDLHTTSKSRLAGEINSCYDCSTECQIKQTGHSFQECLKSRCDLAADTDKEKAMAQFKPAAECLPGKGCKRPVSVVQAMKAAQERVATPCDVVKSDFHGFGFKCKGMADCSLPMMLNVMGSIKASGWCSPGNSSDASSDSASHETKDACEKAGHIWNEDKLKGGKTNCEATKHCIYTPASEDGSVPAKCEVNLPKMVTGFNACKGECQKASDAYKTIVGEGSNACSMGFVRGEEKFGVWTLKGTEITCQKAPAPAAPAAPAKTPTGLNAAMQPY